MNTCSIAYMPANDGKSPWMGRIGSARRVAIKEVCRLSDTIMMQHISFKTSRGRPCAPRRSAGMLRLGGGFKGAASSLRGQPRLGVFA